MKNYFLFFVTAILLLSSCKKKEKEVISPDGSDNKEISVSDPNKVSGSLTINGSSKIAGNLPTPSVGVNLPVLAQPAGELPSIKGRAIILSPEVNQGIVAGYYLQVEGANEYFKIPKGSNLKTINTGIKTKFKIAAGENDDVIIQLPDNITLGTFCINYCAYDAAGQVSNIVKQCVTVNSLGGSNSDFLLGDWYLEKYSDASGETIFFTDFDSTGTLYDCVSGGKILDLYMFKGITNKLSLASNGGLSYEEESFKQYTETLDVVECKVTYKTPSSKDKLTGGWSYDAAAKELIFVFDFSEYGEMEPYALKYKILEQTSTSLVIKDLMFEDTLYLVKK